MVGICISEGRRIESQGLLCSRVMFYRILLNSKVKSRQIAEHRTAWSMNITGASFYVPQNLTYCLDEMLWLDCTDWQYDCTDNMTE
jgi:hypothetical protein